MQKVNVGLDRDRELQFNINAVVELEERFNTPVQNLFSKEGKHIGFGLIRSLCYVGLKHGGMKFKGTTEENENRVGELLQEHWIEKGRGLAEMMELVGEAFKASGVFSEKEEAAEETDSANPPEAPEASKEAKGT